MKFSKLKMFNFLQSLQKKVPTWSRLNQMIFKIYKNFIKFNEAVENFTFVRWRFSEFQDLKIHSLALFLCFQLS